MSTAVARENWEGQVIDGKFPLLQWLGGSEPSTVFRTELASPSPQKAAIKLIAVDPADAERQLSRWQVAATLSHPHLLRIFHVGQCRVNNVRLLYIVMEYAEENLSQVLPVRPLSPAEAAAMLPPIIDALSYVHDKGFVHGRIKPSNITAVGNQLKLTSDSLQHAGIGMLSSSVFDAPEVARGELSSASDVWSLGATLIAALSQTPPEPFRHIARECLRPIPGTRCTLEQIQRWLQPAPYRPEPNDVTPAHSKVGKLRGVILIAAALLIAIFFGVRWATQHGAAKSSETAAEQPAHVPSPAPDSGPGTAVHQSPFPGAVAERVLPDVPLSARNTIQGKIRVNVRVGVTPTGEVSTATITSPGPSKYFARLALQASQRWKFKPAERDGHAVPGEWILRFQFGRAATEVFPVAVAPQ